MLRPATPLTIVLFCAFVLLLVSSISAPVIRNIPLARTQNYNFGVLGFCADDGTCSNPRVGYTTDSIPNLTFNLPDSARHSLSSLLIVHPVAAFMTLIMLALAAAAHLHAPSHSPRYLLALLILTLPTLLITLLAFLVDILLFIPHLAWGCWICLAATILIVISGICLCAMRRTLVSRKARRKRIQENAEMSGENFYNRQREHDSRLATIPTTSSESKTPLVNGAPGADLLPAHAMYDHHFNDQPVAQNPQPVSPTTEDQRLYGSSYSGPTLQNSPPATSGDTTDPRQPRLPEGEYPPSAFYRGRGGPPFRGRGAPRARGRGFIRGGGPPRGPPPGFIARGGYGPDARGAYRGRGGPGGVNGFAGPDMNHGQPVRPSPPGYLPPDQIPQGTQYGLDQSHLSQARSSSEYSQQPLGNFTYGFHGGSQHNGVSAHNGFGQQALTGSPGDDGLARAESPPPLEPGEHVGEASAAVGLANGMPRRSREEQTGAPNMPPAEQYMPARANWNQDGAAPPQRTRGLSNVSQGSSHYYEDVPTKFAETTALPPTAHRDTTQSALIGNASSVSRAAGGDVPPFKDSQYDETRAGARSPATSEQSAWTSVSQRPVNPDWMPGHGGEFNSFGPARRPNQSQARHDVLLSNNPDFSVPGTGAQRTAGRGRGGFRSHAMPPPIPPSGLETGNDGRYPEPAVMTSREI